VRCCLCGVGSDRTLRSNECSNRWCLLPSPATSRFSYRSSSAVAATRGVRSACASACRRVGPGVACWWLTGRRSRWQRNASSRRGCCGRRCVLRMPAVWVWWCCLWRVPCRRWRTVVLAPVVGCCAPAGRAVSALGAAGGGQALVADRRGGLGAQRRRERLLVGVVGRAGFAPTAVLVRSRRDTVGTGEARLSMLRASAAARMLWRPQRRWLGLCAP